MFTMLRFPSGNDFLNSLIDSSFLLHIYGALMKHFFNLKRLIHLLIDQEL